MRRTYNTSAICPKCGRELTTSDLNGYSFLCEECDENFFTIEIIKKSSDFWEINIPMSLYDWEKHMSQMDAISEKYHCDFLGYDDIVEIMDIGWEKGFPVSDVLNQLIEEIEKELYPKEN